ncbi:MAG: S8 family serine peptidase [Oscillospiraceae bacterium]
MFCRHCGSEVKDSAKFCRKCGSDIKRKTIDAEGNGQQGGPPQPPSSPPSQQPRQEPFPPPRQTVNQPPAHGGVVKKSNGRTVLLIILIIALVAGLCVNIFQFINGSHLFSGGSAQKGLATYQEVNPASVIKTEKWGYVPTDQVIVVFKDDVDKGTAQKVVEQMGGTVVGELEFINLYQIETGDKTESELNATLDAVFELEGVELAFPNMPAYGSDMAGEPCSPLNDPAYKDPANSHYNVIGMENAWKILKGSGVPLNKVTVGVLDEAFYTGSSEFDGKTKLSGDTTNDPAKEDSQIIDGGFTHGTMVAHVIGADSKNGGMVGVAGVLEENLHIHSKNVFDVNPHYTATQADTQDLTQITVPATGVAYTDKTLVYLKKMVDEGATVINCSFNFKPQNDNYEYIVKAYEKFFKKMQETNPNVVFVASAGNTGNADKSKGGLNGKNDCPAGIKLPNVVTVGAINNDGSRAEFSSFATGDAELTLSAPGVEMVVGTDENGQPVKASGTSFSAPQVTSAIALLQSINPKLNAEEIKDLLVKNRRPRSHNRRAIHTYSGRNGRWRAACRSGGIAGNQRPAVQGKQQPLHDAGAVGQEHSGSLCGDWLQRVYR